MTEVASKLLDFSQDLDVPLLDATVTRFYAGSNEEVRRCTCCTKHDGSLAVCGPFLPSDTRRSQGPVLLCVSIKHGCSACFTFTAL